MGSKNPNILRTRTSYVHAPLLACRRPWQVCLPQEQLKLQPILGPLLWIMKRSKSSAISAPNERTRAARKTAGRPNASCSIMFPAFCALPCLLGSWQQKILGRARYIKVHVACLCWHFLNSTPILKLKVIKFFKWRTSERWKRLKTVGLAVAFVIRLLFSINKVETERE